MQGYKVFSRDIRYMEAQDPCGEAVAGGAGGIGQTIVCLRWSLTSLVDLGFVGGKAVCESTLAFSSKIPEFCCSRWKMRAFLSYVVSRLRGFSVG